MSTRRKNLTADDVLQVIHDLYEQDQYVTLRMIADELDVATNSALYWVRILEDDGRITRNRRPGSITPR